MKIIPIYLIASIFITIFMLYVIYPEPNVLLVEPDVRKEQSIVYHDNKNVCYRYYREEIIA